MFWKMRENGYALKSRVENFNKKEVWKMYSDELPGKFVENIYLKFLL